MSVMILVQIIFNIFLGLAIFMMWSKLKRPPKDDPRLSRGLQLLQSKISVLEDLSDRTEVQVRQLTALLDKKAIMLQNKIYAADEQNKKVEQSLHRSLEVAEIFQDKIPHDEIIERKEKIKYIQAAQMAHQGNSIEDIVERTGIPKAQVEFISKVNKDELMFDEGQLPAWAAGGKNLEAGAGESLELTEVFENKAPEINYESLDKLGVSFREACVEFEEEQKQIDFEIENSIPNKVMKGAEEAATQVGEKISTGISHSKEAIAETSEVVAEKIKASSENLSEKVKTGSESLTAKVKKSSGNLTTKLKDGSKKLAAAGESFIDKAAEKIESKKKASTIEIIESESLDEKNKNEVKNFEFPRV